MRLQENEVVVILCLCNSAMITRSECLRSPSNIPRSEASEAH